ncbi:cell division protein ZipA [Phocoenobacter skyensis]|uniref:Cell division protein ZipA n=1 Tax=Phocoenobacter skyensis TaxID=97481 RepID=A0ABT9JMX6_9PAST|nr:cell division protein ZipA [Pasteurella skyensis]MDP8080211.1 cell division protein ZipA [Pasteurella skyensis]MDP8086167.1 cell division protein ZipA [Pasteurella skyensis]
MELSIIFFISAGILIALLIGYSILSSHKEKSQMFENNFSNRPQQPITPLNEPSFKKTSQTASQPERAINAGSNRDMEQSLKSIKISLNDEESVPNKQQIEEIQPSLFSNQDTEEQEPELDAPKIAEQEKSDVKEQIITLYLVAPENTEFKGEEIIHKLEEMGFQYGEHQIFHRHIDNAASPIIFSVANMIQPGVFDLSKIDSFSTIGLVFFMHIPSLSGKDVANLRLMISTVESLSQSLGGFVLNDKHTLFDEKSHLEYIQRVQ